MLNFFNHFIKTLDKYILKVLVVFVEQPISKNEMDIIVFLSSKIIINRIILLLLLNWTELDNDTTAHRIGKKIENFQTCHKYNQYHVRY